MISTWVKVVGLTAAIWIGQSSALAGGRGGEPFLEASLEEKNQSVSPQEQYPKPYHLFLNQKEGAKEPTSFTLHEDTGVRCISAPCPSDKKSQFRIRRVISLKDGSVRYIAREMTEGSPRGLQVVDHRFSTTPKDILWEVHLTSTENEREFSGNPQPVPVVN